MRISVVVCLLALVLCPMLAPTPASAIEYCSEVSCLDPCGRIPLSACMTSTSSIEWQTCSNGVRMMRCVWTCGHTAAWHPCYCEGGTGCFLAGTLIKMANGSTRPIESIQQGDRGNQVALAPWAMQRLLGVVGTEVEKVAAAGRDPIILCSSRIRLALRRMLERRLPNVVVLSFAEVTPQTQVEAAGNIEVNVGNEAIHR